jgi:ubiquinone/menaquinone biosynthesis C-methylase UbiE
MDYDQSEIAANYDEARALTPGRSARWQRLLSSHVDRTAISLVVDLGCGTGRFSGMLAAALGAQVIGLDPSEKMIDQAQRKSATSAVFARALAHELPLPESSVDLMFMSQIYHHLPDPPAVARECRRILRAGGYVCIRTATRENDVAAPTFSRRCGLCSMPSCRPEMRSRRFLLSSASRQGIMRLSPKS